MYYANPYYKILQFSSRFIKIIKLISRNILPIRFPFSAFCDLWLTLAMWANPSLPPSAGKVCPQGSAHWRNAAVWPISQIFSLPHPTTTSCPPDSVFAPFVGFPWICHSSSAPFSIPHPCRRMPPSTCSNRLVPLNSAGAAV